MKNILVEKDTNLVKDYDKDFLLYDNCVIVTQNNKVELIYSDLSSLNSDVYEIEDEIVDFVGNKYMFIDGEIVSNPDYIESEI